jgi:hypothetical protein
MAPISVQAPAACGPRQAVDASRQVEGARLAHTCDQHDVRRGIEPA